MLPFLTAGSGPGPARPDPAPPTVAAHRHGALLPAARAALAALALALVPAAEAAPERFTVCSLTINSDDEIRTLRKRLPASRFDFVELVDPARAATSDKGPEWFERACRSGVRCDVLVLSGHFANAYAGTAGTTFAGGSGQSISLDDLAGPACDSSCPGVLSSPLEVFLFGCRTLAPSLEGRALSPADLALLSAHHVPERVAERIVEVARYGGEDTSNLARMRYVFSGVPRIYGFSDVAPTGGNVAPRFDAYLRKRGDYAAHLGRLRAGRTAARAVAPDGALERSLRPSTFVQTTGLDLAGPEHEIETSACRLGAAHGSVLARLERMEALLEEPRFLAYVRAMNAFFAADDPSTFGAPELAVLARIREHPRARAVVRELVERLDDPTLRHEILHLSRSIGWIPEADALRLQREIVLRVLRPPVYGESRDLICAVDPEILRRLDLRAEDVPVGVYRDEFGIQALGCLRPSDPRIHERLGRSLTDSREWVARLAATALAEMAPPAAPVPAAAVAPAGAPRP